MDKEQAGRPSVFSPEYWGEAEYKATGKNFSRYYRGFAPEDQELSASQTESINRMIISGAEGDDRLFETGDEFRVHTDDDDNELLLIDPGNVFLYDTERLVMSDRTRGKQLSLYERGRIPALEFKNKPEEPSLELSPEQAIAERLQRMAEAKQPTTQSLPKKLLDTAKQIINFSSSLDQRSHTQHIDSRYLHHEVASGITPRHKIVAIYERAVGLAVVVDPATIYHGYIADLILSKDPSAPVNGRFIRSNLMLCDPSRIGSTIDIRYFKASPVEVMRIRNLQIIGKIATGPGHRKKHPKSAKTKARSAVLDGASITPPKPQQA